MSDVKIDQDAFAGKLSPADYRVYQSIVEGAMFGDQHCILLLKELDTIKDNKRKEIFFKAIEGETSEMALKKWYYIDKQVFYDTRNYL